MANEQYDPEQESTTEKITRTKEAAVKTGHAISHGVAATKAGVSAFVSTVTNPVFWVATALVLVMLLTWSGTQVIGQNENANGCAGIGGNALLPGGGSPGETVDIVANRNAIGSWLMSTSFEFLGGKAMTKAQAAAVVGNWHHESGLNPGVTQSHFNDWGTNEEIAALGAGNAGKATGLAQWDASRRLALVQFAMSKTKNWYDMGVQLEWFKTELNGFEGSNLVAGGFDDPSKSATELAFIFNRYFERSADWENPDSYGYQQRELHTLEFMAEYDGAGAITTGGSCLMAGSFDASSAVALAIGIAYPTTPESRVGPGDSWGKIRAPQAYHDAKAAAEEVGGKDPLQGLFASCDRFVATVVKVTMDPDIPWGSTTQQYAYLNTSPKWERYDRKSHATPGDVWVTTTNGHVILYIGPYNGVDSIAHASYLSRVGGIGPASYVNEYMVDVAGRQYAGYRYVGG